MADPRPISSPDNQELRDEREVLRVEREALALERETLGWSDSLRLNQPGYRPVYSDLLATLAQAQDIAQRMAAEPERTPAEVKGLQRVDRQLQTITSEVHGYEAESRKPLNAD